MADRNSDFDFAAGLKELESITQWFEAEEIDLDQALVKFERGMELAERLRKHLSGIETKVEKIKGRFKASDDDPAKPAAEPEPELF
jgi:exodeoxyribonuclease VII small subunit